MLYNLELTDVQVEELREIVLDARESGGGVSDDLFDMVNDVWLDMVLEGEEYI